MDSYWQKAAINGLNIEHITARAVLVKMTNNSGYKGFVFWHPKKLMRSFGKYRVSISFTKDFAFKLKKYGKGKTNFDQVMKEKEIGVEEFKEAFNINSEFVVLDDLKDELG